MIWFLILGDIEVRKYSFMFKIEESLMLCQSINHFTVMTTTPRATLMPVLSVLGKDYHPTTQPQTICSFVECSILSRNLQMTSTWIRSLKQMNPAQYFPLHTKAEILNKEMLPASDTKTAIHIADWQVTLLAMSTSSITRISIQDLYLQQQHP